MARISELHYSNAYARTSGVSEFLEVALGASDNPADFTVSFYEANGQLGFELNLDDPGIEVGIDPDNNEVIFVISADDFPIFLTDPDGGQPGNYEAFALTNTTTGEVIDFYDIGGGTRNIVAQNGAAAGATSENLPVLTGPEATRTTLQFNQPDPDRLVYESVSPGDTGLACFASGTLIDTPTGPRRIEHLRKGDMVCTLDAGDQPLVWTGGRSVPGTGAFAPVLIAAGTLGAKRDILVSPQHRVLITGWRAELLFGETEMLVAAKALVNGRNIRRMPCDIIHYVHAMFDRHQIVCCSGLMSESFFPGAEALNGLQAESARELLALFPSLRTQPGRYGHTARPVPTLRQAVALGA